MSENAPSWVTLTDDETVVWSGGPGRIRLIEEILVELLIILLGVGLFAAPRYDLLPVAVPGIEIVGLALVGVGLVLAIVTVLRFRATAYLITNNELYLKHGLISRSVQNTRLNQVQDTGFSQSALQRVFGLGNVYVSTAGRSGTSIRFKNVPNPARVNGIITEQLDDIHT